MSDKSNKVSGPYSPSEVEDKIYRLWEKSGFFNPDKLPRIKKNYSIAMAPPNVTGSLHMGHALEYTLSDILIRAKRMQGYRTLWLPGTDHAGIATQNVVEKTLRKEGISRHDLGQEKFLEKVWEWKGRYGNIIIDQLKKLGISADWSRIRFTMDAPYQEAVIEAFVHYFEKGFIYRGERAVNWCWRCGTGLSDLEVEYKEERTKFYYIKYGQLSLGTSRPETKLGDTALAVHPTDNRYAGLVDKEITIKSVDPSVPRERSPKLKNISIGVIADEAVDPNFGTGVIKVTPAHDMADYEIYKRHPEIPIIQVIGPNGRMTEKAGIRYTGLKVAEAREQIIKDLSELGLMERVEDYTHNLSLCYRCGTPIEPLLSKQWFLKMEKLAEKAIKAIRNKKTNFHPERWEKIYFDWLENIKDWCISRQIWWGHRLPVWFCQKDVEKYIVSRKKPTKCSFCQSKADPRPPAGAAPRAGKNCSMKQSSDVLDTWFSSALWPFATLGWPRKTKDLRDFYPMSVNTNDRGIINLWDARMIYSGLEFMGKTPFKDLIIHATILTKDGQRMSKSLGTGIDPMDLIRTYGSDATRFGLIWQAMGGQDIRWSEEHVNAGKKFANKVWNASRFVIMNLGSKNYDLKTKPKLRTAADKKILNELSKIQKNVTSQIENFDFGQALHDLYDFFWHSFCDEYIESAKLQIDDKKYQESTRQILTQVLTESLKLIHPFMPFITEEIWKSVPVKNKKPLLVEQWPK